MAELTRRGFIAKTSVVAGAALASGVALQQVVSSRSGAPTASTPSASTPSLGAAGAGVTLASTSVGGLALQEPLVVHVRDTSTGEIALMTGTQEIVYRDPEMVARLVRSATLGRQAEG